MSASRFAKDLEPHLDDALRYCQALCAKWSPSEAEDVLQQALLKALEHYEDLKDPSKFKAWLFQIITRTFYMALRRSFWKRFIPLSSVSNIEEMPSLFHQSQRFDEKQVLLDALSKLPPRQRVALLLYELGGFSVEEIAAMQRDKSRSAVKSRLSRARQKLRRYIVQSEQGQPPRRGTITPNDIGDLDHETLKLVAALKAELKAAS